MVVVDDEPYMLEGMRLMVDWAGCGFELCGTADSAQEALRLAQAVKPHLLITDILMPGMLGTDLAAIVRRYHPDTALIFFSGHKDFTYAQSAIRFKASAYLLKPIDVEEVHAALLKVKAELDERREREPIEREHMRLVRDHVLRRIAGGDICDESLMRAGVLMGIKQEDSCVCAVLDAHGKALPESALYLFASIDATAFTLAPGLYGLCLRQFELDIAPFELLASRLSELFGINCELCVGRVGRGIRGFASSLSEAMEAQGVQFEKRGSLRVYRPVDASVSKWIIDSQCSALHEILKSNDEAALADWLTSARTKAVNADMFRLRTMALTIETYMAMDASRRNAPYDNPLRPLWREDAYDKDAWLSELSERLTRAARTLRASGVSKYPEPVAAALAAIGERYGSQLTIGNVADELQINAAYLGQLIRKHTGQTFHKLLLMKRVAQASKALRRTSDTVGSIAADVGFQDVDYFSRQFRTVMGMSPNVYRRADEEGSDANEV